MKCVYCLKKLSTRTKTRDHILPRVWRNRRELNTFQAWVVDSCGECNKKFGQIEDNLFPRLAMMIADKTTEMQDIRIRGMTKYSTSLSKNDTALKRRNSVFKKIIDDLAPFSEVSNNEIILNPYSGERSLNTIRLDGRHLSQIAYKFAASLEHKLRNNYLGKRRKVVFWLYGIQNSVKKNSMTLHIDKLLNEKGTSRTQGDSFKVCYFEYAASLGQIIYRIDMWKTFQFYILISKREENERAIHQIPVNTKKI